VIARAVVAAAALVWIAPSIAAAPSPAGASPAAPQVVFHLSDPRISEASGIAAGIASPGVVYVHNDSGDSARFFALDAHTGRTLAVYAVPGATNVDWEDIAVAPDARGVPSVWLGDIGDNGATRSDVAIYRVDEPHVDRTRADVPARSPQPQVWRLRYPSGPVDAESLAVSTRGAAYIVTKSASGGSQVYAVPARPDASRVQPLRAIGSVHFGFTGTPGGPGPLGQLTATAADLSRGATLLVVRTYTDAYLWRVRGGDLAAAIRTRPVRLPLPAQPKGEGIAFDGARLLVDSETVGSQVYEIGLPPAIASPDTSHSAPAAAASASARSVRPRAALPTPPDSGQPGAPGWIQVGAGVLVVAMLITAGRVIGRGRRHR
jgi:hypothetical protein